MAVFAKEERGGQAFDCKMFFPDALKGGVHTALHRDHRGVPVRRVVRHGRNIHITASVHQPTGDVLAVHQISRIAAAEIVGHGHLIASDPRFVPQ